MYKCQQILWFARMVLCSCLLLTFLAGCGKGNTNKVDTSPKNIKAQIAALKNPDPAIKTDALVALGAMGPAAEPAIAALVETLKEPGSEVRQLAAYALGQIGPKAKSAEPALKGLIADPDRTVMTAAMNALRNIDPNNPDYKVSMPNVMTP